MARSFFECFTVYNTLQSMCIGNLQSYKEAVISQKLANIFLKCSLYTHVHVALHACRRSKNVYLKGQAWEQGYSKGYGLAMLY